MVLSVDPVITLDFVRDELGRRVTFQTQPGSTGGEVAAGATIVQASPLGTLAPSTDAAALSLGREIKAAEKKAIERALKTAKGNRSVAARLLNLSRSTLYAKLQEHGLL